MFAPATTTAVTAAEVLRSAGAALANSAAPRLDAELLLGRVIGQSRPRLLARLREPLPPNVLAQFETLLARRAAGEPLAYLLGRAHFCGLEIEVTPAVLIPRPETELLVEWAMERRRWMPSPLNVLDVGTGSGAIALAIASYLPDAVVHATDISAAALVVARRNARRLGVSQVTFHEVDLMPPRPAAFDLVLANLPYVGTDELEDVDPAVIRYEPHEALFAGADGLDALRRLLTALPGRLAAGGAAALEIGWRQGPAVLALAQSIFAGACLALHQDLAGLDRWVTIERPM